MGFPLTEEDIKRAKDMLHDADMADALDPQTIQSIGKELTADDFNMMNISELPHEHHDDTENELGLLTFLLLWIIIWVMVNMMVFLADSYVNS